MLAFASCSSLDILSRLKGIETELILSFLPKTNFPLDILSRLKGIETIDLGSLDHIGMGQDTLDILSRLKGIETISKVTCSLSSATFFGYTFPFEGN